MNQHDISRDEAAISSELRSACASLLAQANTLLAGTRGAVEALARQLGSLVEDAGIDDPDAVDAPGRVERVERAVALIQKISSICKNNADVAERCIRIERQVRGEPDGGISSITRPIPTDGEQLVIELDAELDAVRRSLVRRRKTGDLPLPE